MAARDEISIVISAKDTASKILDRVADDAEQLEKLNPTVIVDAADRATDDLDRVIARTNALDGDTARVILEAEAGKAESELKALQGHLAQLDGEVATATIDAKDQASARLDKINAQMRELDGKDAKVSITAAGLDKLDKISGALPGRLGDAASTLAGMGGGAAGAAAGVGAAAVGAFKLAEGFANAAIQAQTLSTLTGATVEESSQLASVWQSTGADIKDLADVMLQTNGVLAQQPELVAQLGIEGSNVQERFLSAVEAMRKLGDSTADTQIKSQLFGEEGVRQVGALITMYGSLDEAMAQIEPLSAEDAQQAVEFKKTMAEVTQEVQKLAMTLGRSLLPAVSGMADGLEDVLTVAGPVLGTLGEIFAIAPTGQAPWAVLSEGTTAYLDRLKEIPLVGRVASTEIEHLKKKAEESGYVIDDNVDSFAGLEAATTSQAKAAKELGLSVEDYNKLMGETGEVINPLVLDMKKAADEMIGLAKGADNLSDVQGDLNPKLDAFATSLDSVGDAFGDSLAAFQDAEDGVGGFTDALADGDASLRGNIDTVTSLRDTVQTGLVQALQDAGGNFDIVRQRADGWRQSLIDQMDQLGLNTDEQYEYLEALGLTPEQVETAIQLSGTEEARLKIGLLQTAIDNLPEDVQTTVTQQIIQGDYQGALNTINSYYARNPAILPVNLDFRIPGGRRVSGPGGGPIEFSLPPAGPTPPSVAAPVTNVTINAPRGTRPQELIAAADRYARRNGSRALRR